MRRSRLPRAAAIALAALAAVLLVPGSAHQASAATAVGRSDSAAQAVQTVSANAGKAADMTAATGGLCSVPGIGDIGGLLGFCAAGSSGVLGALNNVCQPSLPSPEPANAGIDAMVAPPSSDKQPATLYEQYGVAGDYWAATNLQCSDMTSLIGNNVAGMVFDAAKSIDRVTITVYQSAAGEGILSWLQRVTDTLITSLGKAIYFPYLAVVVILAAIWLAWQGLIRKRATRTIEGTVWMVVACAAAIFLIGKPADVTGIGRGVSDGISQALNVAFAKLPSPGPTSCVPLRQADPQVQPSTYSYTSGSTVVDQNADELWTVLVCKPWLVGEFGTSAYSTAGSKPTIVNTYGRALLWSQAIAVNEKATPALIQAKQDAFAGIASSIQTNDPAIYPLFQGKQWTTRLEVGFLALFAAVVAGVLVLLISVTLILLKLSFLLLLIVGPFFLLIGVHPGFGRVVAVRWVELLIGVLLKQAAIALVLSVLMYCYALIMGTTDSVLPWALKILMIALVTVAAFIYRKPFQHLFSAVGYGVIGSQDRAEADLARAGATARANTIAAATVGVPGFAAYRAGRWARRNPGQAASLAMAATSGGASAVAAGLQAGETAAGPAADATVGDGAAGGPGSVASGTVASGAQGADGTGRMALAARARAGGTSAAPATDPPPLNLPTRNGSAAHGGAPAASGSAASGSAAGGAVAGGRAAAPGGSPAGGPLAHGTSLANGNSLAGRSAPPGAWPVGRGVGPSIQGSLRPPAATPPRSASGGPTGPGAGQPGSAQAGGSPPAQPLRTRAQQSAQGQQPRLQRARPASAQPQGAQPQGAQPQRARPQRAQPQRAQPQRAQPQRAQPQGAQPQRAQQPRTPAQRQQPQGAQKPVRGRAPENGRLRFRRSAGAGSTRQSSERQGKSPSGGSAGPARAEPGQQGSVPGQSVPWQGQPMSGPLARPAAEPARPVPFWLRPMRRK
jgi:hypothetical protein